MRLFVAADLGSGARRRIVDVMGEVTRHLRRAGAADNVRWVADDNLHVTLKFLGEVDDGGAERVRSALARPLDIAPFDIGLRGAGAFPPQGPLRIVWIGIPRGAGELRQVYDVVERRLQPIGFPSDDRPFRAHVTIGRFRRPERRLAAAVRRILDEVPADVGACHIDHVTLYESHLLPEGSKYVEVATCGLAA